SNLISTPSERPIQLRCMVLTCSGHSSNVSKSFNSSSAYSVILINHCGISLRSTGVSQRQQQPSITCSLAKTVKSCGHQLTAEVFLYTKPFSYSLVKNHCSQR